MTTDELCRLCKSVVPDNCRVQVDACSVNDDGGDVTIFADLGERKLTVTDRTTEGAYRAFAPLVELLRFSAAEITLEDA